jgi:hypothetical protein
MARFLCCLEACGGGEGCDQTCSGELSAFGLCVYYSAPECVDTIDGPVGQCFAEGDGPSGGAGGASPAVSDGGAGGAPASAGAGGA